METKKQTGPPDKAKAVFKAIVYFKNGTARTFYNYHTSWNAELKKVIECEKTALKKLQSLLIWKFKDQYKTGLIIHRPTNTILEKYVFDKLIMVKDYKFSYLNDKVTLVIPPSKTN